MAIFAYAVQTSHDQGCPVSRGLAVVSPDLGGFTAGLTRCCRYRGRQASAVSAQVAGGRGSRSILSAMASRSGCNRRLALNNSMPRSRPCES